MQVFKNFPLSKILYYKIGGKADFILKIQNKKDLLDAFEFIKKNKIKKVLSVGLGSNLLVSDKGFNGAILWFCKRELSIIKLKDDNTIEAFASEDLDEVIKFAFDNNLIGLEWAGGLPSTVGGAVRGNAGAFGGEIGGNVDEVEIFEVRSDGEYVQKTLKAQELKFGYRDSLIKQEKNLIIASCLFKLTKASEDELRIAKAEYLSHIDYRNKNHPMEYPSCGSVFKNIIKKDLIEKVIKVWSDIKKISDEKWHGKIAVAHIIQRLGFSGFTIGGAKVSEKHANYIVNFNNAKFDDVVEIIEKIKEKFSKTFGFYPDLEVEIVEWS